MNKTYRIIWSEAAATWVAVAEIVKSQGQRSAGLVTGAVHNVLADARPLFNGSPLRYLAVVLALAFNGVTLAAPPAVDQLPTGGQVVAGSASLSQSANILNINQSTQRAVINWQSFDVGQNAAVNFNQPGASAVTLNRVLSSNPSQIFGQINAPGQVFLTNASGIYFSSSASANVGGLLATTHSITDADFMAGINRFSRNGATGSIINDGTLTAKLGGYIALLAPEVRNQGIIVAQKGTVALAAGEMFELNFSGTSLSSIQVSPSAYKVAIDNGGAVEAEGGLVILSARALNQLQGSIVHSGVIDASSMTEKGGKIVLEGDAISLKSGSSLKADGATSGGTVLVGGDWQGGGSMHQATTVTMAAGATIDVSATKVGAGGTAVLWSDVRNADSTTRAYGSILARGGKDGGNGGRIETSGHWLDVAGIATDASAPKGTGGEWLLDPYNIVIASAGASGTPYAATYTSGADSVILASDIVASLNGGTSVSLITGSGGAGAGTISVDSAIAKTSGGDATLTLKAARDIIVANPISSSAGKLNVVLWSDYDQTLDGGVRIDTTITTNGGHFWAGSSTNGGSSTWNGLTVGNAPSVGGVNANWNAFDFSGSINTGGGEALLWAGAGYNSGIDGIGLTSGSASITTGAGNLALIADVVSGGVITINTTGTFSFAPNSTVWDTTYLGGTVLNVSGTLSGNDFNGTGDVSWLKIDNIGTLGGLTFGKTGSTSDIAIDSALTINGPISLYGGNIGLNSNLATTASGSAILISASGNITTANSAKTITANNGNVSLIADVDANGVGLLDLDYTTLSVGSGNVLVRGETMSWNVGVGMSPTISSTTGTFTFESSDASFGQGVDTAWFNLPSTLSGLTVGKTTNTQNVVSTNALSVNGPIALYGSSITLNAGLSSTASGADILLKATAGIVQAASVAVTSNAGDITYWSNSADGASGGIYIVDGGTLDSRTSADRTASNISTATGGGSITLGGGSASSTLASGTVVPTGYAQNIAGTSNGVGLGSDTYSGHNANIRLYSGGGDIVVRGKSTVAAGSSYAFGVQTYGGVTMDAGTNGNLMIVGQGSGSGNFNGVELGSWAAGSVASLYKTSGSGNITITGTASGGASGSMIGVATATLATIEATGTGSVSITGSNSASTAGGPSVRLGGTVLAGSGAIHVEASSAGGWISTWSTIGRKAGFDVAASSSNVTLSADNLSINAGSAIDTSGMLTLQPYGNDFSAAVTMQNLTLASTLTGLTIGKSATSADGTTDVDVTIGSATSIAGPISIYGGNINLNANLTSTASDAAILAQASSNVLQAASVAVTTNGGSVTYDANHTGSGSGGIVMDSGASITSNGGNITLGGGLTPNTTYALGTSASAQRGIWTKLGTTLDARGSATGGNIVLNGQGATGGEGILLGFSGTGSQPVIQTNNAGTISLNGWGGGGSTNRYTTGIGLAAGIIKSGSGAINIVGLGGGNSNDQDNSGIYLWGSGTNILSTSGAISLTGTVGSSPTVGSGIRVVTGSVIGYDGSLIASSSSDITLTSDTLLLAGALQSSGALVIEPLTTSFSSAFSTSGLSISGNPSSLRLGKVGNTADITLANALSIAGPISVYGGNVTVNSALSAAGDITLVANTTDLLINAPITNTSASAATLLLKAGRHVSLGSTANITSTAAAMNSQFWADSDNSGDGIVQVASTSIDTHGGWLKFGNNQSASINGSSVLVGGDVYFNGASAQTISTGGGALDIYGETIVSNTGGLTLDSGGGNVGLHGVLNSGNAYAYVDGPDGTQSWTWARTDAKNGTAGGAAVGNSYLVTITSRLENALAGLTAGYKGAWIGAYRAAPTSSFAWTWADGPEAGAQFFTQNSSGGGGSTAASYYSNFGSGEPNGTLAGNESVGQFFGTAGLWNDLTPNTTFSATPSANQYAVLGYVRETNLASSAVTIHAGTGQVTIDGGVGGSKALASLTVNAASTTINGAALVTTGAQTYDNALTVNSTSDLHVAASALTITNANQALSLTATGNITVDSPSSVAGTININGGNVILNAGLTTTNVTTGNIAITTSGLTGSGGITLVAGRGLSVTQSGNSTYGGIIAGTGATFTKDGAGALTLTGDSTYTGATTIDSGALQLGNGGATGSLATSGITNNGTLKYHLGQDTTVPYAISGTGGVEIVGGQSTLFSSFLTTSAQTIASNTTVYEVLARLAGARENGASVNNGSPSEAGVYWKNYDAATNTGTFQVQMYYNPVAGNTYTKVVFVKLTQSGNDVQAQAYQGDSTGTNYTVYANGNLLGTDYSTAAYAGSLGLAVNTNPGSGYGVDQLYGSSKITFTGDNTYSGTTTLSKTTTTVSTGTAQYSRSALGTLQLGAGGTTGTLASSSIVNNGLLIFDRSDDQTLTSNISGNGDAIKQNSNTLSYTGDASYIGMTYVIGGTLSIGAGGTSGSIAGNINNKAAVAFNRSDAVTYAGLVSGTGTLSKSGAGNLTLTADQTYTGATTINAGQLIIDNDTPSTASSGFDGAGTLVIQPSGSDFTSAFSTTGWTFGSTLGGLTIGKSATSADGSSDVAVTVANAISIAGPINLYGADLTLNAGLTTTGTISLIASGNVTEGPSGFVVADQLALLGGNVNLTHASNAVTTLAASGVSGLTYTDSNALTLGTVGSTNGVSASGTVSIGTTTDDLTLTQNVATTNNTATALVLNAGINTAAGTATGGNIVLSGSPTVSVGAGGTAKLYSGGISGSTGLTALVGSGSGRFRYNSDESASNFTLALSTGMNAIYREQPTISSVAVDDQSITYGDATPTWTFAMSGSQNGDSLEQVFSGAGPTVTVGGTPSTAGKYTAGDHTLTVSGGLGSSQLGYANMAGSYTAGTLTVGQKTLNVSYTGVNKTYDGTTNTSVTTGDNRETNDDLTITRTAAFTDKNANNGVAVNVTGVSLSGTDAGNYTISATGSTTADIAVKAVTLTAPAATKVYDGTTAYTSSAADLAALSAALGVAGDTVTGINTTFDTPNWGAGKVVSSMNAMLNDGNGGANYSINYVSNANGSIIQAPVTVDAVVLPYIYPEVLSSIVDIHTPEHQDSLTVGSQILHVNCRMYTGAMKLIDMGQDIYMTPENGVSVCEGG